jgi:hypothetical protein
MFKGERERERESFQKAKERAFRGLETSGKGAEGVHRF